MACSAALVQGIFKKKNQRIFRTPNFKGVDFDLKGSKKSGAGTVPGEKGSLAGKFLWEN